MLRIFSKSILISGHIQRNITASRLNRKSQLVNIAELKAKIEEAVKKQPRKPGKKKKKVNATEQKVVPVVDIYHNVNIVYDDSLLDLNLSSRDYTLLEQSFDLVDSVNSSSLTSAVRSQASPKNSKPPSLATITPSSFSSLSSSFTNCQQSSVNRRFDDSDYEIDEIFFAKSNLQSYIHVCIYNDNLSDAHLVLLDFINKYARQVVPADIESSVELLAKGWARKGSTENVKDLLKYLKQGMNLTPSLNFYEYYLLALSKQMKPPKKEEIVELLCDMRANNLKPEGLFQRSTLNCTEITTIKQLISNLNIFINYNRIHFPRSIDNIHIHNIVKLPQKPYDPIHGIEGLREQMGDFVNEQFAGETNSIIKVPPINAKFYDVQEMESESFYQKLIEKFEKDWRIALTKGFENYLSKPCQRRLNGVPVKAFMTLLEPEVYVNAMMEEITKCGAFSEHYSPFASGLFETLGKKIMAQYILRSNTADSSLSDFRRCYEKYVEFTKTPELLKRYNPREYWHYLLENGYHYHFDESKQWSSNIVKEIGKDLYELISKEAKFDSHFMSALHDDDRPTVQPVLSFIYKNHEIFKMKMEVRVHPLLIRLYEGARSDIPFECERLPMLSPPVPWIAPSFGGNLLVRNFLVRTPQYYPKNRIRKTQPSQMYPTYDALNALSLCPWKINTPILDLAIQIFQNKGNLELDVPVSLSHFGPLPKGASGMDPKERAMIYIRRKNQRKEQAEMYSLWVDCLYKLSISNFLRDRVFWFPINTDFRSRVYPIPPNFNHLGSDLSRSLLTFAKGKPLGEKGLRWLKIHLINLTGFKKRCSSDDRLKYCDEVIDLIMDSADNPLGGEKWWMQSDEKWQTLSCCIELTNAIRSGNPEGYISHMPIHQDGSCNGLQHYAALGRDVLGARSVNLAPSELPQDVYSDVAALVEIDIENDFQNEHPIAKIVKGNISRKVVKQTVMTYVYGVTRYGAKLQVLKRLKEDAKFPEEHKTAAATYISDKIFASIRKMFTQTRVIQDWLTNSAQIISNDYSSTVEWVTPIGYPVIQSYFKTQKKNIGKLYPNAMKQKNAFPANFIHSLDSTHMMLTALECHRNGLTFASVHDCYWTHACDIDQMNLFCRRQFVELHSQPILDNLGEYLKELVIQLNETRDVPEHYELVKKIHTTIPKGEFDLNTVMDSEFFFS